MLEDRLRVLFQHEETASTDQVAEALMVRAHRASTVRAIRSRNDRYNLGLEHIGYNTWVRASA